MAHSIPSTFRRRLFTIVSALSLLLCLATLALWVRSYWLYDLLRYFAPQSTTAIEAQSAFGDLYLCEDYSFRSPIFADPGWTHSDGRVSFIAPMDQGAGAISFLGFGFASHSIGPGPVGDRAIFFPHWFLAMLFAILPAIHLRGILRTRRRNRIGLCQNCGYDLRVQLALSEVAAATESNGRALPPRCPECGLQTSGQKSAPPNP